MSELINPTSPREGDRGSGGPNIRRSSSTSNCPLCKTTFLTRNQWLAHNDSSSPTCCQLKLFPCVNTSVGCQAYHQKAALDGHIITCPFKTVHSAQPYLLPFGSIVMWVGLEPPPGWSICNGSEGTPDLTEKFIKLPDDSIIVYIRKCVQK